jgi:hypothetical protein
VENRRSLRTSRFDEVVRLFTTEHNEFTTADTRFYVSNKLASEIRIVNDQGTGGLGVRAKPVGFLDPHVVENIGGFFLCNDYNIGHEIISVLF